MPTISMSPALGGAHLCKYSFTTGQPVLVLPLLELLPPTRLAQELLHFGYSSSP